MSNYWEKILKRTQGTLLTLDNVREEVRLTTLVPLMHFELPTTKIIEGVKDDVWKVKIV